MESHPRKFAQMDQSDILKMISMFAIWSTGLQTWLADHLN